MFRTTVAVVCALLVASPAQANFDLNDVFIFHENHSLLLTVYMNVCYFTKVEEREKAVVQTHQVQAREKVFEAIQHNSGITPSDLTAERQEYMDLLANFHCRDLAVYDLQVDLCNLPPLPGSWNEEEEEDEKHYTNYCH